MSIAIAQTSCERGAEFIDHGCAGTEIKMF